MVDTQCLKDPINTVQRESPNTLSTDRKDRPDPCSVDRRQHPVALITDGRERPDHLGADGSECGHMLHTVRRDCPDMFSTDMESHHMVGRGMAAIKSLILSNVKEEAEDYMIYQQDPQTQQSIDNLIGMADIRSFILSDVKEEAEECLINHQDSQTQLSIDHLIGPGSGAIPAGTLGGKENVGCDPVAVSGMRQNTTDNRTPFQQEIGDEGSNPADQGYGLQTWLMTPFGHPQTDPHKAYNHAHCRSRNIRERSFGLLKARFRCLDLSAHRSKMRSVKKNKTCIYSLEEQQKIPKTKRSLTSEKKFTKTSFLLNHQRLNTFGRPFHCTVSEKRFTGKKLLLQHQRTHTGVELFLCTECEQSFTKKINLLRHRRIHSQVRLFQHTECENSFTQNNSLLRHQRSPKQVRPFHCTDCEKSFNMKKNLLIHQRSHAGVKALLCMECEKSFNQKQHLVTHLRIHTGVKSFHCSVRRALTGNTIF